jgi:hypothetical protein
MLDLSEKTLLVSIRRIDNEGQETVDTFFGIVASFNENTVQIIRRNGDEMKLPYDEEAYEEAERGFYELKDGSTCEDPAFIVQWTVYASEAASNRFRNINKA